MLGFAELRAALSLPSSSDLERFEAAFAKKMESSYALEFPHGRTALILLLEALGIRNKQIIVPAYTCVVVPHAVVYSGNVPVFVDSQEPDFNMDLARAAGAVTSDTGAIVATSIFGYPCDLDQLEQIRQGQARGIPVIQDCAHSFGARWKGRPVQKAGIAAFYGLNISKLITSIFGGMITTDDEELYLRLKTLRAARLTPVSWRKSLARLGYILAVYPAFSAPVYAMTNWLERTGVLARFTKYYDESVIDMPADYLDAPAPVEARVGLANLERYDSILRRREEAADFYFRNLRLPSFRLPPRVDGATYSHFVVRVADRTKWLEAGLRRGVQLGQLIEYNIPEMKAYGGRSPDEFPVSAELSRHTINLPVWGGLPIARAVTERMAP